MRYYAVKWNGRSSGALHVDRDCNHISGKSDDELISGPLHRFDRDQSLCSTCWNGMDKVILTSGNAKVYHERECRAVKNANSFRFVNNSVLNGTRDLCGYCRGDFSTDPGDSDLVVGYCTVCGAELDESVPANRSPDACGFCTRFDRVMGDFA